MRIIILILALVPLQNDFTFSPPSLNKILSKQYSFTYFDESRRFTDYDSVGKPKLQSGFIYRNSDYMVSNSDSMIGILQDSVCLDLDNSLKTIDVGPKSAIGNMLLLPFFDPYAIFDYAINNKFGFQKYAQNGELTYDFFCFKQDAVIINIQFSFPTDQPDKFSIKIVYQQYPYLKQDIIKYKFESQPFGNRQYKISDFLNLKNGSYQPKVLFSHYFFTNAFLLFKKHQ